jgi:ribosome-associated translation inhibitor RaiA
MKVHVKAKHLSLTPGETRRLNRFVGRLRKRLKTFDPDLVHLDLAVEKHPRKAEFTGSVRLFVVNRMLAARRNAGQTPAELLQGAFSDIEEQLDRFKSDLRRDAARKRHRSAERSTPRPVEPRVHAGR